MKKKLLILILWLGLFLPWIKGNDGVDAIYYSIVQMPIFLPYLLFIIATTYTLIKTRYKISIVLLCIMLVIIAAQFIGIPLYLNISSNIDLIISFDFAYIGLYESIIAIVINLVYLVKA